MSIQKSFPISPLGLASGNDRGKRLLAPIPPPIYLTLYDGALFVNSEFNIGNKNSPDFSRLFNAALLLR